MRKLFIILVLCTLSLAGCGSSFEGEKISLSSEENISVKTDSGALQQPDRLSEEGVSSSVSAGEAGEEGQEDAQIVCGVCIASDQASYQVRLQKLMTEQAEVKNIRILWNYADWDPELQNSQIENMIERRVDALIISPVNSKSILESLKDASSVGIPVINLNMKVDAYSSVYIDTYVGASSSEEGVLAAELADILLPDGGKAAIIEGSAGTDPQIYRTQAFIDELRDKPEIQIEEILSANWDRKQAKTCAEELLQKYADLSLIYCQDNNMAAGAIEAVKRSGRSGKVYVIGIGEADEETVGLLKEGSLSGFIVQDPEFEAVSAINSADQLAKGRKIRPWIKNPVSILTADTIGDYQKPIPYL